MARRRFRYDPKLKEMVEVAVDNDPMLVHYAYGDIPAYKSILDGSTIEGRRQHEEHLKRNNCVPYEGPTNPTVPQKHADPVSRRELIWELVDRSIQQRRR